MPTPFEIVALGGYDVRTWHVVVAVALAVAALAVAIRYGPRLYARFRTLEPRWQVAAIAGATLAVCGGALLVYNTVKREGDVLNEDAEFAEKGEKKLVDLVRWPYYGYDGERTRYLPTDHVRPPFDSSLWSYQAGKLLEFSPIAIKDRLYVIDKDATVISIDADTGKPDWKTDLGTLNASSPAYADGKIYGVSLSPGQAFGLEAKSGKVDWKTPLAGRSETSPVVVGNKVIVGCECGTLYGLDVKEGKIAWTVDTAGAIKGGVAVHNGVAFFGNYSGEMFAVRTTNGAVVWKTGTQGASFGRTGSIYSTPAVAFGRVYVGSKDSRVYSFVEDSGELAWSQSTGDEVYPAPAVADPPGAGPSVFIGSLDQRLYAMDAEDGDIRWVERVGGPVIGAATVLGNIVYVSGIGPNVGTVGFDVADGSTEFEHELGEYNPVISDGRRLYLTGSSQIRAFEPKTKAEIAREKHIHAIKKRREKEARQHRREVERIKARRKREREAAAAERKRERRQEQRQRQRERRQGQ
jgi:outer membrane protein assembly factor BamB